MGRGVVETSVGKWVVNGCRMVVSEGESAQIGAELRKGGFS